MKMAAKFFVLALAVSAGVLLENRWGIWGGKNFHVSTIRENDAGKYQYIRPLLTFDTPEADNITAYKLLKKQLEGIVADKIWSGEAEQISIYFRGLARGNWIGVNSDAKYTPANLLKVPTMIAFYKLAESNPGILSNMGTYTEPTDGNNDSYYRPAQAIEPGRPYSMEELIRYMIIYSDNNATRLLHQNIREELLQNIYADLGLDLPENGSAVDYMTAAQYSYFFRILYNATYLSRTYSEQALQLLGKQTFSQGISAGVPAGTKVAQKFGERTVRSPDGTVTSRELHDCGIVYYPAHPYLLCVMTRGDDFNALARTIKEVSETAYLARKKQFSNP